ncbi:MAG: hypothetical protein SRB2_02966 [Desulfobacteraceae bacterium Eth-SRB2]|nr:MAG: hypothetical protein SRB2_02966 [Desulfobacteraceae bacterium Eth-SRB2]
MIRVECGNTPLSSPLFRLSISYGMLSYYLRDLINRLPLPVISPDCKMKYQRTASRKDFPTLRSSPPDLPSWKRPCLRIVFMIANHRLINWVHIQGTSCHAITLAKAGHPIRSRPCRAYTTALRATVKNRRALYLVFFQKI